MKKILIITTSVFLSGCANFQNLIPSVLGSTVAGAVASQIPYAGRIVGNVAGAVVYALASDLFTQTANQQATEWQTRLDAEVKPEVAQATENGRTVTKIVESSMIVSKRNMVFRNHLSSKAKNQLIESKNKMSKANGTLHVICPQGVSQAVMNEIASTGVSYHQDNTQRNYIIELTKTS